MSKRILPACILGVCLLAAVGCGEVRPPAGGVGPVEPPGVGEIIRGCGVWILRAGIAAMAIAAILAVFVQSLRPICDELAILGAAFLVLGASLVWLGDNPWILWGSLLACAAWAVWRYWAKIQKLFRRSR